MEGGSLQTVFLQRCAIAKLPKFAHCAGSCHAMALRQALRGICNINCVRLELSPLFRSIFLAKMLLASSGSSQVRNQDAENGEVQFSFWT